MNINHYCDEWIQEWCEENGWTDWFRERYSNYWAFPPGAVMPEPIPTKTLRWIKAQKGLSHHEKFWSASAFIATAAGAILSYLLQSPMPLVLAFAFDTVAVALLEEDE